MLTLHKSKMDTTTVTELKILERRFIKFINMVKSSKYSEINAC